MVKTYDAKIVIKRDDHMKTFVTYWRTVTTDCPSEAITLALKGFGKLRADESVATVHLTPKDYVLH